MSQPQLPGPQPTPRDVNSLIALMRSEYSVPGADWAAWHHMLVRHAQQLHSRRSFTDQDHK